MSQKLYSLPELPFGYGDLAPQMSAEQLRIHHDKHHNAYVTGANAILEKLDQAKAGGDELDMKALDKAFAFQVGGFVLHSLFWKNLAPAGNAVAEPDGPLAQALIDNFGSFEIFQKRFTGVAMGVEGSGWATLVLCRKTGRLLTMQIEKHNVNIYPTFPILMVLDMYEHAYYIDYKNDKGKYVEAFWKIVNWREVQDRYETVAK